MLRRVQIFLAGCLLIGQAGAVSPPGGMVRWGEQSYRLEAGASTSLRVDFAQIPVRRWVLILESDGTPCHLNVRRVADGSLLYDERDLVEHEVDVPWGTGESLSAVIRNGRRAGVFAVSIWGPPRDGYLRSYGYDVNRALESLAAGDRARAQEHLLSAMSATPRDTVAAMLWQAVEAGAGRAGRIPPADAGTAVAGDWRDIRDQVTALRGDGRFYEALDRLQRFGSSVADPALRAELHAELALVLIELESLVQAELAINEAAALGLDAVRVQALRDRLAGR